MAEKGQGGGGTVSFDDPMVVGGFIIALYFIGWLVWHNWHTQLSTAYGYYRYALWFPLYFASLYPLEASGVFAIPLVLFAALRFGVGYKPGLIVSVSIIACAISFGFSLLCLMQIPQMGFLYHWITEYCAPSGLIGRCQRDFSTVEYGEISGSSIYANILFSVLVVIYAVKLFLHADKTHPKLNYIRTHTIQTYIKAQSKLYPHLKMFGYLSNVLIQKPLDDKIFGMSLNSKQFVFHHRLVSGWDETNGEITPSLDRKKAELVFKRQLGSRWRDRFSVSEALLAAIAMPRVAATDPTMSDDDFKVAKQDADDVIAYCWKQFKPPVGKDKTKEEDWGWLKPDIDTEYPMKIIKKYINHPLVQGIVRKHGYNRTILFALFIQARRIGVLQPAEMRWMRFFDRELWYVLQSVGRQAPYAEGGGVFGHYLYEVKVGEALIEPQLDKAVSALEQAFTAFKFTAADRKQYEALLAEDAKQRAAAVALMSAENVDDPLLEKQ